MAMRSDSREEDEMTEDSRFVELRKSICNGDWNALKQFFVFDKHPLDTIILSGVDYTALYFAILVGKYKIAEDLIKMMSETDLEKRTASSSGGHTALTLVAYTGRTHVARCIVQKNSKLLTMENVQGDIPVTSACSVGHKEMTQYLYSVTPPDVLLSQHGNHGIDLMIVCMCNKILDICLDLIQRDPKLTAATGKEEGVFSTIFIMSRQPNAFLSGCKLRFWQIWIYRWLKVKLPTASSSEVRIHVTTETSKKRTSKYKRFTLGVFDRLLKLSLMLQNFSGIKQIYDLKLTHLYTHEILRCMCEHLSTLKVEALFNCGVVEAMFEATKQGMVEFVVELLKVIQPLIVPDNERRHVFTIAIQYRQENIFNLLYGINEEWRARFLNRTDRKENNMLHVAGEIAPPSELARISGAALQMQRELQWFKEVERIIPEWCKEYKNGNGKTPYEVFSNSHEKLVKEGEEWMRGTANSFIIVGILIVTIMFAVAFTLPGGNAQDGFPNFLQKKSFMIFIISDAISFFTASTSVLMFLGILTSRFAQEDFLESLPRKLIIGLSTLFISIAAMMVSFSAALLIMLQDRWWAIIPIITMASIPVTIFVWLQFPLLVEIITSTYFTGRLFKRNMKPWL
ncbi:hypothetical protein SLA2020_258240 [Shorea laevis]